MWTASKAKLQDKASRSYPGTFYTSMRPEINSCFQRLRRPRARRSCVYWSKITMPLADFSQRSSRLSASACRRGSLFCLEKGASRCPVDGSSLGRSGNDPGLQLSAFGLLGGKYWGFHLAQNEESQHCSDQVADNGNAEDPLPPDGRHGELSMERSPNFARNHGNDDSPGDKHHSDSEQNALDCRTQPYAKHSRSQKQREEHDYSAHQQQDVGSEVEHPAGNGCSGERGPDRHKHGRSTFSRVQETVVGGGMLATEEVAAQGREQGVDLRPAEERERAEDHEQHRSVRKADKQVDGYGLQTEGQGHGFLPADVVRDPSPEGAA